MAHLNLTVDHLVRAPVARVFPYLAEPRNRPQWQYSLARVEMLTDGPPRVGTRWRDVLVARTGTVELEIVELVPDVLWAERARGGPLTGEVSVRFLPVGVDRAATGLRLTMDGTVPGPIARATSGVVAAGLRADLRRLERNLMGS